MSKPLVIDLCCGLGGWSRGFIAEGWEAIGFDIEKHEYGDKRYPGELILKDITQVNGYDLRSVNPALVVASPPCQRYSYMAMPWSLAKEQAREIRAGGPEGQAWRDLNRLFNACSRIAYEAGVPIVLENVKGAQPWVGSARAHFGSFYLWGDVSSIAGRVVAGAPRFGESLRPAKRQKKGRSNFHFFEQTGLPSPSFYGAAHESSVQRYEGIKAAGQDWSNYAKTGEVSPHWRLQGSKNDGGSWFNEAHNTESGKGQNPVNGVKGTGGSWFTPEVNDRTPGHWKESGCVTRCFNSQARKAASAMIAEIPFELARYVARAFKPA